jgi:diguanylate cyclase (GGDEF)-like protein/PAS domain S-box-containing protein
MKPTEPDPINLPDAVPLRVEGPTRARGTSRGERWFRSLIQNSSDVVMILEAEGTVRYVSPAVERVLGYQPEDLVGTLAFDHVHPEDIEYMSKSFAEALEKPGVQPPVEYRVRTADGSWRHMEAIFSNRLDDPYMAGVVANVRDVTERKEAEARLEYQAFHDPLTDLPNRELFLDRLGHALARTQRRPGRRVAVLYMDLDDFKVVNDSLGHEAGDRLLVAVGERLKGCLRPEDTLARFGGDEFTVLLEEVEGPEEAVRVAERVIDEVRDPFVLDGREFYVRASIGIALSENRTKDPENLLRDADTAMYWAKDKGSGYSMFDPSMYEQALGRFEAANYLRRAIEREEFVVHYQPIMSLQTGKVRAVEALVRWEHPERGLLDPWEFVAVAEESGLVVPMGEGVLREACLRAKEWQEAHPRTPPLVMSVNLSARQLSRPDLAETVERVLRETGLEGNSLTLDITETVYVKTLAGNTATLDRLRKLGVKISIDDFGMGYSWLSYLKRLPADSIKIDRSFVKGFGEDAEDTAIVRMIIELAHTLGIEVVAEGVESEEQARQLREIGCDMAQGFYFSKPFPPEAAWESLAD